MNNFKKKILISIFLLLSSCGYEPLFSTDKNNFSIINIKISGDKNIGSTIERRLKIYKNTSKKEKNFYIEINSSKNRIIASKDTKGDPKIYSMEINVRVTANSDYLNKQKSFKEIFNYNNQTNKFDLNQYEKSLEKNMTDSIVQEIILFLHSIK